MACWRTKAAISLKRVKIEEQLLWMAYRNSPMLFLAVYHRNKSPYNFGKSSRGRSQRVPTNFQGTHILGALRGHLCDSTAFLFNFKCIVTGCAEHLAMAALAANNAIQTYFSFITPSIHRSSLLDVSPYLHFCD